VFIFDEKYGSAEITVKVKGVRGEDYSPQQGELIYNEEGLLCKNVELTVELG